MPDTLITESALAAAQPTAEEVATRAYLAAMVAAGYELQRTDRTPLTIDEAVERLAEAGRRKLGATVNVVKVGGSYLNINGWL